MTIARLASLSLALVILAAGPALAQTVDLNPVVTLFQGIIDALTGPLGIALGTLALMATFLGWLFGYIDFSRAIFIVIAIVGVAAAPTIVGTLFA